MKPSKFKKKAYVEHPCSVEDKQKLNSQGFKVVDIRFKPEKIEKSDKVVEKTKQSESES